MKNVLYYPKNIAEIHLDALRHNYRLFLRHVQQESAHTQIMAVVKANAYGHGCDACVSALLAEGVRFFAVSDIAEALQVRKRARHAEILILGHTLPENAPLLVRHRILQTCASEEYARALVEVLRKSGEKANLSLHIKLDTGMNRLGFSSLECDRAETVAAIRRIAALPYLHVDGVFSHLATADDPDHPLNDLQAQRFSEVTKLLRPHLPHLRTHLGNTAGAIRFAGFGMDLVRVGIGLYGYPPAFSLPLEGLRPVMRLYSHISHIHLLRAGESLGYGATYRAERDQRIATVSIGYADGILRSYKGGFVTVRGKKHQILGNVCMDQLMIDAEGEALETGDRVYFFGTDAAEMEDYCNKTNTIPYELLCLISPRVKRIYK